MISGEEVFSCETKPPNGKIDAPDFDLVYGELVWEKGEVGLARDVLCEGASVDVIEIEPFCDGVFNFTDTSQIREVLLVHVSWGGQIGETIVISDTV